MRIPDVIHAGFPKCASTFLQSWFDQHPDVFMVFKGEYLSPFERRQEPAPTRQEYLARFQPASPQQLLVESDEHLLLPLYHPELGIRSLTRDSSRQVFQRLADFAPQARLILVIRNQADMIVSAYSQYVLAGGTLEINEFARELLRCSGDGQNHLCMYFGEIHDLAAAAFHDRLLILLLEDFQNDLENQIGRLQEFLRLPANRFRDTFRARRVGLSARAMRLTRHLNRLLVRGRRGPVTNRYRVPRRVYRFTCNLIRVGDYYLLSRLFRNSRQGMLNEDSRRLIRETFARDNALLAARLSRNLEGLGYECEPAVPVPVPHACSSSARLTTS
jgi:hypothetical protein